MIFRKKHFDFDLAIIGSGAGGSVGAHYARALNKKVVIFEKAEIGGECPNWACVPTKALLHASHLYKSVKNAAEFGIKTRGLDLDFKAVHKWRELVVSRTGAAKGEETFKKDGIEIIKAKARFLDRHRVEADGKIYSSKNFIIATGSTVFIPPIPGMLESGFVTFKEAIDLPEPPKSLFILGGGAVGCEFAQIFSDFDSKVTIADNVDRLLFREDKEVSDLVQALFENDDIKVLTGINVERVEIKGKSKIIHYIKGDSHYHLEVDQIIIATGKRPVLDFDPEKAGIQIDGGHIKVNQYLQTNVSNIYAAGDVIGPYQFTHTGYYQSYIAANNALSSKKVIPDYTAVPRCVFIKPEVASVGLTEFAAKEKGIKVKVGIMGIAELGRANTSNHFDGFVKVIVNQKDEIIGGSIIAPTAGEMIHELTLAVKLKVKSAVIVDMLHAYPTFSEGIKVACSQI